MARLVKACYFLGLFAALVFLLRPSLSHGQGQRAFAPLNGMGMGMGVNGIGMGVNGMGMVGMGMNGMGMVGLGINGMGMGMVGMGMNAMGMNGMGMGMNGMGINGTGMGGNMGMGSGMTPLQLQLYATFGAVPVNSIGNGMGNSMMGFAGKNPVGFNGGNGL